MALTLDGSTGYLEYPNKIVGAYPITMVVWGTRANTANQQDWISQCQSNATRQLSVFHLGSSDAKQMSFQEPGQSRSASKTVAPNTSTTNLQCFVLVATSAASQTLYFGDNLNAATNTNAAADGIVNHDRVVIGALHYNSAVATNFTNGALAEAHFYNVALTATDVGNLMTGATAPESVAGWVDGWTLQNYNAGGTYTSIGGTRTLTAVGGVSSSSLTHPVTRTADTTAPNLSLPTAAKTGSSTASGSVSTDEGAGTMYRLASTNATETAATIIAAGLTSTVSTTGVQNVSFTGLSPNTTYYAHYVQKDLASTPNTSTAVHSANFTTDALPAAVLSGAAGTATGTTAASATVSTTISSGTLYYLFSTNATETSATIKASGASQAVAAGGTQSVTTSGLTASTTYYSHFVQVANALDSNVANGPGFTTVSVSAPVLSSPSATAVTTTTATANVSTTVGSGTLYVLASVNANETAATIKASGVTQAVTATGAQSVPLTALTPGTTYYLHFVHNATSDSGVLNSASFNTTPASVTVTVTGPSQGGKKIFDGSVRASVAYHVTCHDATTHALVTTIAGLSTSTGGVPTFTTTALTAGTEYLFICTTDGNNHDIGAFFATPV